MFSKFKTLRIINYWKKSASYDLGAIKSLFNDHQYANALFFGHLVFKKNLKALIVFKTQNHAPYSHNLLSLAKNARLKLNKEETSLLITVNKFNLRCRYPDEKLLFYQKCNQNYCTYYQKKIIRFYLKICLKLNKKRKGHKNH